MEISDFFYNFLQGNLAENYFEIFGYRLFFDDVLLICLIFFLYKESVDDSSIWDLYNYIIKNNNLEIKEAEREIYEEMKCKIPKVLTKWLFYDFRDEIDDAWVDNTTKHHLCHLRMFHNKEDYRIDIYSSLEMFDVYIFEYEQNGLNKNKDLPFRLLSDVKKESENGYHKIFDFKDYNGLEEWVNNLVKEITPKSNMASLDN